MSKSAELRELLRTDLPAEAAREITGMWLRTASQEHDDAVRLCDEARASLMAALDRVVVAQRDFAAASSAAKPFQCIGCGSWLEDSDRNACDGCEAKWANEDYWAENEYHHAMDSPEDFDEERLRYLTDDNYCAQLEAEEYSANCLDEEIEIELADERREEAERELEAVRNLIASFGEDRLLREVSDELRALAEA